MSAEHPAITQLRDHQRQLDADGCEVGVSRQAIDETLEIVGELLESVSELCALIDTIAPAYSECTIVSNARITHAKATGK